MYLRQVALLQILSQLGCFIPAQHACVRLCDQLFSRVGCDDRLETNSSTFMLECSEMNFIIQVGCISMLQFADPHTMLTHLRLVTEHNRPELHHHRRAGTRNQPRGRYWAQPCHVRVPPLSQGLYLLRNSLDRPRSPQHVPQRGQVRVGGTISLWLLTISIHLHFHDSQLPLRGPGVHDPAGKAQARGPAVHACAEARHNAAGTLRWSSCETVIFG
jgi:hypothetical protein